MWIVSLVSLVGVTALCVVGTFHRAYSDNTLQRAGMAGIALSMLSLIEHVWDARTASPACAILAVSLLAFAIGVAQKVARFQNATETDTDGIQQRLHHR